MYNYIKHYCIIHTIGQCNQHMSLSYQWSKLIIINVVILVVGKRFDPRIPRTGPMPSPSTYHITWDTVTKKEGSIEHTTHLWWPTNPIDWTPLFFSTHAEFQTLSHSNYSPTLSSPPHRSEMYRHDNATNLKRPSTFSLLTQGSNKEAFHLHLQSMYNLENISSPVFRRHTRPQLQCCSNSPSLSL